MAHRGYRYAFAALGPNDLDTYRDLFFTLDYIGIDLPLMHLSLRELAVALRFQVHHPFHRLGRGVLAPNLHWSPRNLFFIFFGRLLAEEDPMVLKDRIVYDAVNMVIDFDRHFRPVERVIVHAAWTEQAEQFEKSEKELRRDVWKADRVQGLVRPKRDEEFVESSDWGWIFEGKSREPPMMRVVMLKRGYGR